MARQVDLGSGEVAMEADLTQRGEDLVVLALGLQCALQRGNRDVGGLVGQYERPPRHPQRHTERGLVGPVAADVTDDQTDRAVNQLDGIEEVAPEQRPTPTRLVPRRPAWSCSSQ